MDQNKLFGDFLSYRGAPVQRMNPNMEAGVAHSEAADTRLVLISNLLIWQQPLPAEEGSYRCCGPF